MDNVNRFHGDLFILGVSGSLRGGHVHKEDENHGGGLIKMADKENKNNDVDRRVDKLETKFEMFMQESRDMRQEMRDRDNQRAAEIRELRQDMKDMQKDFYTKMDNMDAKLDKKIDKLESKIESIGNHVRNLSVAAIIGVATIAVTVVYSIFTR